MSSSSRWSIFAFALVGLALAGASSWVHYKSLIDSSYVGPCDLSSTFSCTRAYMSAYGSVFGVPVAVGGLIWFGLVALVSGFAAPDGRDSAAGSYLLVLAVVGLAVVLYLGYVSWWVLRTVCVLCVGTYVCVASIFVLSSLSSAVPMTRLPLRLWNDLRTSLRRPVTALAAGLYVAVIVAASVLFSRAEVAAQAPIPPLSAEAQSNFTTAWARQPRVDLGIPADGAKVVIVKFNDYECPSCKEAEAYYKPILEKFGKSNPGAIKYVTKDWPWNSSCNFNASATIRGHEASCNAAAAARMAKDRGKSDQMIAWLYANQGTTPAAVREAAIRILGVTDFDKEYAVKLQEIRRDVADGGVLRINSTPTFFINGIRVPDGMMPPAYFDLAISLELKRAG